MYPEPRNRRLSRIIGFLDNAFTRPNVDKAPISPVPHLLKSNTAPTEQERQKIEECLCVTRGKAVNLQELLQGNRSFNDSEQSQIARDLHFTETFIYTHQSLLSLLRILPDELLVLIFLFCLPDLDSQPWGPRPWNTIPSFRISQVCSKWRSIALDTANLWNILGDVRVNSNTAKRGRHSHLAFLKELLQRSRSTDLWIYVSTTGRDYAEGKHPVLDLLVKYEARWAAFGISSSISTIKAICEPESATRRPYLSLARLRKLYLDGRVGTVIPRIGGFAHAPVLTEVSISGMCPQGFLLPYKTLRVYKEGTPGRPYDRRSILPEVLANVNGLEELELWELAMPTMTTETTPLVLRSLKRLLMNPDKHFSFQANATTLLDTLVLPALKELKLGGFTGGFAPIITVTSLFQPSMFVDLQKLFLRDITFPPGELSFLLTLTPYLEELNVDFPPLEDLLRLTNPETLDDAGALQLAPKLRSIVLHARHGQNQVAAHKDEILALMDSRLESRWEMVVASEAIGVGNELNDHAQEAFKFCLVLPDAKSARRAQVTLNSWYDEPRDELAQNAGDPLLIWTWRRQLHWSFPELNEERSYYGLPTRKFGPGFAERLDEFFREMEDFELKAGAGVGNVYVSELHTSLRRLSKFKEAQLPQDKKYRFRARATNILKEWEPLIQSELDETKVDWVLKGKRAVVYRYRLNTKGLPNSFGGSGINSMAYELESSEYEELLWPELM